MKKLLTITSNLLLSFSCFAGAGLVTGTLSPVNNTNNSGGGGGGATNGIQMLNGFGTNTTLINPTINGGKLNSNTFVQSFIQPTNTYTSTASISSAVNSHIFTSTTHTFLGWHAGWQFTTIPDNQQYWVTRVITDNSVYAYSINMGGNSAYTNVAALISPDAEYVSDNNGVKDAFSIGGDGSVMISGENDFANSGALYFVNDEDTVSLVVANPGNTTSHRFSVETKIGEPFTVFLSAPNESVFVNNIGALDVNNGITNKNGNVQLLGPVQLPAQTASRALVTDGSQVIGSSATTATELGYVSGVTSAIQTQINAKGVGDAVLANNQTFSGNDTFSGLLRATNTVNGSGTVFSNGVPIVISNNVVVAGISTNGHLSVMLSGTNLVSIHAVGNTNSGIMFDAANTNDTVLTSMGTNIIRASSNSFTLFHGLTFPTNNTFATDTVQFTNGASGFVTLTNFGVGIVTSKPGQTTSNLVAIFGDLAGNTQLNLNSTVGTFSTIRFLVSNVTRGYLAMGTSGFEWDSANGTPNSTWDNTTGNASFKGTITATNGLTSTVSNATVFTFTMPATTVNFTNTNGVSWAYFIDNTAVTGTAIKKNGIQIFSGLSTDVTILLRANETFSETYTVGTPTLTGNVFP